MKFCQSILEYSLILEENQKQKVELAKKLSKKRKLQKRKTIKEILGLNKSVIRITKRSNRNESIKESAEKEVNQKYQSPPGRVMKNLSKLEKKLKPTVNQSFGFYREQVNPLSQGQFASKRNVNVKLHESSLQNLRSIMNEHADYYQAENPKTDKENGMLDLGMTFCEFITNAHLTRKTINLTIAKCMEHVIYQAIIRRFARRLTLYFRIINRIV